MRSCCRRVAGSTRSACGSRSTSPTSTTTARSSRPCRCTAIASASRCGEPALVIEAEAGAFARWGLRVGDVVEIRETTRDADVPAGTARSGWSPRRSATSATCRRVRSRSWQAVSLVCCEDTRRTGRLLQHAGIRVERLAVLNDHTEFRRIPEVLDELGDGRDVAVVTDAGTPGISDPGERVVGRRVDAGGTRLGGARPGRRRSWHWSISGLPTDPVRVRGLPAPQRARPGRTARRDRRRDDARRALRGAAPDRADARRSPDGVRRRPARRGVPRTHQAVRARSTAAPSATSTSATREASTSSSSRVRPSRSTPPDDDASAMHRGDPRRTRRRRDQKDASPRSADASASPRKRCTRSPSRIAEPAERVGERRSPVPSIRST